MPTPWLSVAAVCWMVAFVLFVLDFRMPLLKRTLSAEHFPRGTILRRKSTDRLS
jgi:hypothetical protein